MFQKYAKDLCQYLSASTTVRLNRRHWKKGDQLKKEYVTLIDISIYITLMKLTKSKIKTLYFINKGYYTFLPFH